MQTLFGLDLPLPYVYIASLAITALLIAVFGLVLKRFKTMSSPLGRLGGKNRQPRLGVVDTFSIDRQRQLVIVRRDGVEHLILIGGTSDLLIESNILRASSGTTSLPQDVQQFAERTRSKPVQGTEPQRREYFDLQSEEAASEPAGEMTHKDRNLRGIANLQPQIRNPVSTAATPFATNSKGEDEIRSEISPARSPAPEKQDTLKFLQEQDGDTPSEFKTGSANIDTQPVRSFDRAQMVSTPQLPRATPPELMTPNPMSDIKKPSGVESLDDNLRRLLIRRPTNPT